MTTSMTRPCFTTQHQTCKTKTDFLVSDRSCLRPTVSDHITGIDYMHVGRIDVRASHYKRNLPLLITVSIMAISTDNIAQGTCPLIHPNYFPVYLGLGLGLRLGLGLGSPLSFTSPRFTCSVMYISSVNPRLWFLTSTQYSTMAGHEKGYRFLFRHSIFRHSLFRQMLLKRRN